MLEKTLFNLYEMLMQINLIDMTLTASIVIIAVMIARVLMTKLPKRYTYILWILPLIRLLVPFSMTSNWSLLSGFGHWFSKSQHYPISSFGGDGINLSASTVSSVVLPSVGKSIGELPVISAATHETFIWSQLLLIIWMIGTLSLWGYYGYKTIVIRRRLVGAKPLGKGVYLSDHIETPFVFGIFSPRIMLPEHIEGDEKTYILAHEHVHIKRLDPIWRALSFLALSIHWFNPLVWASYFLSAKDMERSCDEAVLRTMGVDIKKAYSTSLLKLSMDRSALGISPIAFGESDTKGRIKNILKYKKPSFWTLSFGILILLVLATVLLTNPKAISDFSGKTYEVEEIVYEAPVYSFAYTLSTAPIFTVTSDMTLLRKEVFDINWSMANGLSPYKMDETEFDKMFMVPVDKVTKLLKDSAYLYRADADDEAHTFYMVMQQKNGSLYLAVGYDNDRGKSIRWIFKLKETLVYQSIDTLYNYRTQYIGDNTKVGNIVSYLAIPDGFDYDYFELKTSEEPYGLIIHLKAKAELRADAKFGSTLDEMFSHNAQLALSLIKNAQWVEYALSDGYVWEDSYRYERTDLESKSGLSLWDQSKTMDDFIKLLSSIDVWK